MRATTVKTKGIIRRTEFSKYTNSVGFYKLCNELHHPFTEPSVIGKEGDLYSLYYEEKPKEFEDTSDFDFYAIKLNNTTGKITRKVYKEGSYPGITANFNTLAYGRYIDGTEKVTLYHSLPNVIASFNDIVSGVQPFMGTTYEGGVATQETVYEYIDVPS